MFPLPNGIAIITKFAVCALQNTQPRRLKVYAPIIPAVHIKSKYTGFDSQKRYFELFYIFTPNHVMFNSI